MTVAPLSLPLFASNLLSNNFNDGAVKPIGGEPTIFVISIDFPILTGTLIFSSSLVVLGLSTSIDVEPILSIS